MTDDEIIAVVQAHKEGKQIQSRLKDECGYNCGLGWLSLPVRETIYWNFIKIDYRVTPEPRKPREWIIHIPTDAIIRRTSIEIFPPDSLAHSPGYPAPRTECVHVREVIE